MKGISEVTLFEHNKKIIAATSSIFPLFSSRNKFASQYYDNWFITVNNKATRLCCFSKTLARKKAAELMLAHGVRLMQSENELTIQ